jgi:hypothetical protein
MLSVYMLHCYIFIFKTHKSPETSVLYFWINWIELNVNKSNSISVIALSADSLLGHAYERSVVRLIDQ